MPRSPARTATGPYQVLSESWDVNQRMNQLLLEHLPSQAWRAKPSRSGGRTIAAIFAHVHNIRRKWIRLSTPRLKLPSPLDCSRCTQAQARKALAQSAAACRQMLAELLPPARGRMFLRDGWGSPWPAGPAMVLYMLSHEAHHRGQVCMLAHQLGFRLPVKASAALWNWEQLWKESGFTHPR